jgi:hypothetical protein
MCPQGYRFSNRRKNSIPLPLAQGRGFIQTLNGTNGKARWFSIP